MYQGTREVYCEACGYNLYDKRSGECPECGSAFDRRKGTGYRDTPIHPAWQWYLRNGALLGALFCLGLCLLNVAFYLYAPNQGLLLATFAMGGTGLIQMLLYFCQSHQNRNQP